MNQEITCPLFPLSINVLPVALLPLQIFEPRYIDMVKTCLSKSEGFCIVLSKPDHQKNNGLPDHHDIATYVEIIDFDQLDNGLLGITVQGKYKLRIQERWLQPDNLLLGKGLMIEEDAEDLSEDSRYSDMWSMVKEITNHPEIKKLNLELNLKSSFSVCYILASVLPLTAQEKQTILELDRNQDKLEFLKKIIKKLGG